jgi:LysM repeat protein
VRRAWLLLAGFGVLVLLTGCIAQPKPVRTAAPLINTAPSTETVVAVPNGVMASGSFRSSDGTTSGQFEITNSAGRFTLSVTHFTSTFTGELLISLSDADVAVGACGENLSLPIEFGDQIGRYNGGLSEDISGPNSGWGDPSFLVNLVVMKYPTAGVVHGGCAQPILALAPIAWRIPETHPNLVVHDTGVRNAAWGTAVSKKGKPFSYLTHQGDTWSSIAARFGMTSSDLTWLNPVRHGGSKSNEAYTGQSLNLSPTNRGNSDSRRPTS